jgi:proteic killer suppression protein
MPIQSFKCRDIRTLRERKRVARFVSFEWVARRKLDQLDAAHILQDLAVPSGNRLEALAQDGKGQHSIRIHDQRRARARV